MLLTRSVTIYFVLVFVLGLFAGWFARGFDGYGADDSSGQARGVPAVRSDAGTTRNDSGGSGHLWHTAPDAVGDRRVPGGGVSPLPVEQQMRTSLEAGALDEVIRLLEEHNESDLGGDLERMVVAWMERQQQQRNILPTLELTELWLRQYRLDAQVLLLQAELLQQAGRARDAIVPLYDVLLWHGDAKQQARARVLLTVLVDALAAGHAQRQEWGALQSLYEQLSDLDPGEHRWRLAAARWSLQAGDDAQAQEYLDELYGIGIAAELAGPRDDLQLAIAARSRKLPFRSHNGHWRATVRTPDAELEMLVDTGASVSAVARHSIGGLRSYATGQSLAVSTAGGLVRAPVYRIPEVQIGTYQFNDLKVIILDLDAPIDGLLGMDVLSKLGVDLKRSSGSEIP